MSGWKLGKRESSKWIFQSKTSSKCILSVRHLKELYDEKIINKSLGQCFNSLLNNEVIPAPLKYWHQDKLRYPIRYIL